jgi:hypothetical protein
MAVTYDDAVAELYRAPHDSFVAERKRLSGELKAGGDKPGAARLLKLGRPTLSAWAVNQLWWQARESFDQLLGAAARLRAGDQAATADRRDAVAALKSRAAALLVEGGHAVNEATLRRVTTTLSALAAVGSFDPDRPGALASDRDPPGFDAAGLGGAFGAVVAESAPARAVSASPAPPAPAAVPEAPATTPPPTPAAAAAPARPERTAAVRTPPDAQASVVDEPIAGRERAAREQADRERAERELIERARMAAERAEREQAERAEAERRRAEQEQRRHEVERAARRAERQRLEADLPLLQSDLERRQREVERLRAELQRVEGLAEQARSAIDDARKRLTALGENE